MDKENTTCRVCGKKYFCCSDSRKVNSWRAMACSKECYQEYMNRIEKSRNSIAEQSTVIVNEEDITVQKTKNRKTKNTDLEMISEDIIVD